MRKETFRRILEAPDAVLYLLAQAIALIGAIGSHFDLPWAGFVLGIGGGTLMDVYFLARRRGIAGELWQGDPRPVGPTPAVRRLGGLLRDGADRADRHATAALHGIVNWINHPPGADSRAGGVER